MIYLLILALSETATLNVKRNRGEKRGTLGCFYSQVKTQVLYALLGTLSEFQSEFLRWEQGLRQQTWRK